MPGKSSGCKVWDVDACLRDLADLLSEKCRMCLWELGVKCGVSSAACKRSAVDVCFGGQELG